MERDKIPRLADKTGGCPALHQLEHAERLLKERGISDLHLAFGSTTHYRADDLRLAVAEVVGRILGESLPE